MSGVDTRHDPRDSLFLLASLRFAEDDAEHRVKVRNLSAGGMMAEGEVRVERGARLSVHLRNVGWVDGTVAWVQDRRFGIAFSEEIDARLVRAPVGAPDTGTPRFTKPASILPGQPIDVSRLRKL
ncbi:PilZ domain-containing protein [Pelagerythrobacter rhizovicinus]|uniref:PilZ domain-containing protein n=1 Tax=Pelagerythrobacter rhizovicinus TaxID=2268576 RepID=A0A4Q2KMY5_9SPHN|nr:PilZ domain-containing protein [Pelagerythrobacter rhizovicinus]RXZ64902.1 PilZ domain-containing protein [Pelagerythrobacter rhizovicinus]